MLIGPELSSGDFMVCQLVQAFCALLKAGAPRVWFARELTQALGVVVWPSPVSHPDPWTLQIHRV